MALSGLLFIFFRIVEFVTLIPIIGMLAWFVSGFTDSNQLTPNYILVLFITSVLAGAWALFTLIGYARTRHSGLEVALVDLAFVGALIGGVVVLRGIANQNCSNFSVGSFYVNLGPFGYYGRQSGSPWAANINKPCAMLKASFAFGIMNIIFFFITFLLALLIHRHHREPEKVVVKREYHSSRHGSRRSPRRSSRDYDYRPSSSRRSHHSASRRQYYV
ncbi:MAG: hypothetical protein M1821_004856 [Bathelium mastoideum]|nr:MAG: hypothetical protein M1821_004856 [Bathelium mastoideum]KAI9689097.1 MAG: hypothetical protein M1822_000835 [Bathelium mastoideum]